MDFGPTKQIISDLRNMEFGTFDKHTTIEFLGQLQCWRAMFDALEIDAARRLQELSVTAPADLAAAPDVTHVSGTTRLSERQQWQGSMLSPDHYATVRSTVPISTPSPR